MTFDTYDELIWHTRYGRTAPAPAKRRDGQRRIFEMVRTLPTELKNKTSAAVARELKDQFSDLSPASIETYVRKGRSGK